MSPSLIKSDQDPEIGTPKANHFEILLILIEAYEAKHHAINFAEA